MTSFFTSRMKGERPLEIVFWRDMLVVGSVINVVVTAAALALFSSDYPGWVGLAVNFLPVPYNIFLLVSVWKASEREGGSSATTANVVAAIWFFIMLAL